MLPQLIDLQVDDAYLRRLWEDHPSPDLAEDQDLLRTYRGDQMSQGSSIIAARHHEEQQDERRRQISLFEKWLPLVFAAAALGDALLGAVLWRVW